MRLSFLFLVLLTFLAAAGLSAVVAGFAVTWIERGSEIAVRRTLDEARHGWAEVTADGLRVVLSGTAPDEATRFSAISLVGGVVDAARIIDEMEIKPTRGLAPPRFSAEILRNESGLSVIGLIPAATDRDRLLKQLNRIAKSGQVADLLETAKYDAPAGWSDAMAFGINALQHLGRAKVSIEAGQVSITAISDSVEHKQELEKTLSRAAPPGLRLAMSITAPRPVITPFTLRYTIDGDGARFDACSAESEASRDRILAAARAAGLTGPETCTIGMGVPSPNWAKAVEQSLAKLAELGQGTITFANADITLIAAEGTDTALFDKVVGELENALPKVFALHAVLPVPVANPAIGPPEFIATLSPEGQVQLRGRLSDENLRHVADSYAKARFGSANVYTATRLVEDLPADWPLRVLAGIEALSHLQRGSVSVTPDHVTLRGMSHQEDTPSEVAKLLSAKLGEAESYELDISYEAPPEPEDKVLEPEICMAELAAIQRAIKITFEPGSATIASASRDTMGAIADLLAKCGDIRLEIQGHTDSQGREEMNQNLSQARAQSVLNELRARRIPTSTFAAKGYGESTPIADNGTEEGREENRRIEFVLVRPAAVPTAESTLDATAEPLDETPEPDAEDEPPMETGQ